MKTCKKLFAVLLAMAMVLALGVSAYAEGEEETADTPAATTYTITIKDPVGEYEAYQIFAGDLYVDENGVATLSNVSWGTGVSDTIKNNYDAEQNAESFAKSGIVSGFAFFLQLRNYKEGELAPNENLGTPSGTYSVEDGVGKITGLEAGYYLVRNVDGSVEGDNVYTESIVTVVRDVEVSPKGDKPTVEKKVKDTNDSTGETSGWQDSADADIGDSVTFQITGTLPENYSSYYYYEYTFHDTLSAGLTYNGDAKVYINSADEANEITSRFTVSSEGNELTISCETLKSTSAKTGDKIIVVYTATLNDKAVVGAAGNANEVSLEYYNNPGIPSPGGTTGETPKDKVVVFTYQLLADKVDEADKPLEGAGFTLYKKGADGEYKAVGEEVKGDKLTTFVWNGIDDGDYKLVESTTPAGYNTMDDQYFTVSAEHQTEAADPQLTKVEGKAAEGSTIELTTASLTLNDKGTEDKADDVVSANAQLTTTIENKAGSVLPSTGGIGTTLFYVIGGVMVVAAGVLLVVRRKVSE